MPDAERARRSRARRPDGKFVEIAEIPDHPWFVAVQFHPEFKSKPLAPAPAVRRTSCARASRTDGVAARREAAGRASAVARS